MGALKVGQVVPLPGGGEGEVTSFGGKTVTVRILPGESLGIYTKAQLGWGKDTADTEEVS